MDRLFTWFASWVSFISGQPLAFVIAFATIFVWGVTGPMFGFSDTWQLVINTGTTIVTFLMVFLIQNSTNRDAAAIQAKLDELLRAVNQARGEFIGIEHMSEKQLKEIKDALETESGAKKRGDKAAAGETLKKLLTRR